jgi:hypothetical protein
MADHSQTRRHSDLERGTSVKPDNSCKPKPARGSAQFRSRTMHRAPQRMLCVFLLATCLNGCSDVFEQATVTLSYAASPASEQFAPVVGDGKRVEDAFRQFSERNGYKCRAHVKRVQEFRCRGPKDLHLVFEPSLNKKEFVAVFSWTDLGGRTHEEFMQHVQFFKQELGRALGENNVRLEAQT